MEKEQIIDTIYQRYTAAWVKEDFEGYKWYKFRKSLLDMLYEDIANQHFEFAETNNDGEFDPNIFETVLQRIVN